MTQVTYCGFYCGLCAQCNRIPKRAEELRETMRKEGWDQWGNAFPEFKEFWSFLNGLVESKSRCSCRGGTCGPPFCGIRKYAQQKGIEMCPFCDEYPCNRILGVAKGYVIMLADSARMKAIGIDAWIAEQEERHKTGFAYVDIRCYPYDIPHQ